VSKSPETLALPSASLPPVVTLASDGKVKGQPYTLVTGRESFVATPHFTEPTQPAAAAAAGQPVGAMSGLLVAAVVVVVLILVLK
jgi:hypothetical protein